MYIPAAGDPRLLLALANFFLNALAIISAGSVEESFALPDFILRGVPPGDLKFDRKYERH